MPHGGGQGIYIRYLSKALMQAGHEVDVISGPPYPDLYPGVRLIRMPSLDLYATPNHVTALRWHHLRSFTDFFEWFSMLTGGFSEPYTFGRRVVRYFRENGFHYDLVHDNQSLCYGLLQLQKRGIPLVTTVHHPITRDLEIALASAQKWYLRLLIRRWHNFLGMQRHVIRRLHHVVTVSEQSRRDIASAFGVPVEHLRVIYNGIDTEEFRPLPDQPRIADRLMVTASADTPLKGLDYLLRALPLLTERHPQLHLLIVGRLKEDGDTNRLITQLGIRDRLTFVSNVDTQQLVRYYAEASVAVIPSIYEGFGLPAGEAMACGVPVVSTNGGALPEVVGDAGIQVPTRDAPALAEAIHRLLADPDERARRGRAGRERILARFSWQVAADVLTTYYHQVLGDANANR